MRGTWARWNVSTKSFRHPKHPAIIKDNSAAHPSLAGHYCAIERLSGCQSLIISSQTNRRIHPPYGLTKPNQPFAKTNTLYNRRQARGITKQPLSHQSVEDYLLMLRTV
ncbi:hypothetical protein Mettu_2322 [Methylobacter tundripaludum SV96]|uniref:Uncharacterized protein n=1 Tax=Methylobacter tundripaludum (strain ATCC BAA-1195 / DSM 17260 / SV96) TaxID=697282 RepID=G3IXR0_METTV|nr:hypothetical protein Mettu_2322 [Methylobacter tundripaludum SV96]